MSTTENPTTIISSVAQYHQELLDYVTAQPPGHPDADELVAWTVAAERCCTPRPSAR